MIDGARLVYEVLTSDSDLVAETGGSIYGPPGLPAGFTLKKAVMFYGDGGDESTQLPVVEQTFTFHCYGETSAQARRVYSVLSDALWRKAGENVTVNSETWRLIFTWHGGGPYDLVEPELGWPYVRVSYILRFIREAM